MPKRDTFHSQQTELWNDKIYDLLDKMPGYVASYINMKFDRLAPRTKTAYLQDLFIFFNFLQQRNPSITDIKDITEDDLNRLTVDDIAEYGAWLSSYRVPWRKKRLKNEARAKARKFASLSSFFRYMVQTNRCEKNPVLFMDKPKIADKPIVALDGLQKNALLTTVRVGRLNTSKTADTWHERTRVRDEAILVTLIGTGLRVSELVGIDISDLSKNHEGKHYVSVVRKGGDRQNVFLNDDVVNILDFYLKNENGRKRFEPVVERDADALFLSRNHARISAKSIEVLVKKYANAALGSNNNITPHKMRSTFASDLMRETGDVKLVSEALNHKSTDLVHRVYSTENVEKRETAISGLDIYGFKAKEEEEREKKEEENKKLKEYGVRTIVDGKPGE